MSFGENLKRQRVLAGFDSAYAFARHCKIQYQTYISYESDRRKPTYKTLMKLARALHMSLDALCDNPVLFGKASQDVEERYHFFKKESQDSLKLVQEKYGNAKEIVKRHSIEPPLVSQSNPIFTNCVYLTYPGEAPLGFTSSEDSYRWLKQHGVNTRGIFSPSNNYKEEKADGIGRETGDTDRDNREKCLRILVKHLAFLHMGMVLILCGQWKDSEICCAELLYAMDHNVMAYQIKE